MRVIAQIPHPRIGITVFQMNDKYIIKLEAGPMEQTFKIPQSEVAGLEGITKMLDEEFMKGAIERFNQMFLSLQEAKSKH